MCKGERVDTLARPSAHSGPSLSSPPIPSPPAAPPSTTISQPQLQTTKHTCSQEATPFILPILAHTVPSAQTVLCPLLRLENALIRLRLGPSITLVKPP